MSPALARTASAAREYDGAPTVVPRGGRQLGRARRWTPASTSAGCAPTAWSSGRDDALGLGEQRREQVHGLDLGVAGRGGCEMAALIACWLRVVNFDASMCGLSIVDRGQCDRERWVRTGRPRRQTVTEAGGGGRAHRGQVACRGAAAAPCAASSSAAASSCSSSATRCCRASTWCSSSRIRRTPSRPMPVDGQLGDLAQQLDVAPGVAAAAAAGAARADQAEPVVGAQRLRVQPGQLGGHADDVDRDLGTRARRAARRCHAGARAGSRRAPGRSNRLARRSVPAVASR